MKPILWTFRRCPYAMRARLAIAVSGIDVEYREILLRDKPDLFLQTSPKATVPVLVHGETVLEESLEVMRWALGKNDPDGWLEMPNLGYELIAENDGPFKTALDRYKYTTRYSDADREEERIKASAFLYKLDGMLSRKGFLLGDAPRLADMAVLPFVRQFANTDRDWFDEQPWHDLRAWLDAFLVSPLFSAVMRKRALWSLSAI